MVNKLLFSEGRKVKKLSEIKDDTYLVIKPLNDDSILMDKTEFMQSHYYLDREPVKVYLGKAIYAHFDLHYALKCIKDDTFEDWSECIMNRISVDVKKRIENEINGYLQKVPTSYYPGEEVDWKTEI